MISNRYKELTGDDIEAILTLTEDELKERTEKTGLMVRLPGDVKGFIEDQATHNGSSQNSEIIRAVRERMERVLPSRGMTEPAASGK